VKGDITSADLVNYLLASEKIDTIMHFAAQVVAPQLRAALCLVINSCAGSGRLERIAKLFCALIGMRVAHHVKAASSRIFCVSRC